MCSGCGIISLLWHDAGHRGPCTALELDPDASALCVQAVAENGIDHITPVQGDLRMFCAAGPEQGKYDFAACNRPILRRTQSPDPVRAAARHTVTCTTEDVAQCAAALCGMAAALCCASVPTNWWKCCVPCAPPGWNPSDWPLCASAPAARPGCFWSKPKKAAKPGLKLEPDILIESGVARYGK